MELSESPKRWVGIGSQLDKVNDEVRAHIGKYSIEKVTADSAIATGAGAVVGVLIAAVTTAGVLTLYDNTAESGDELGSFDIETRAAGALVPQFIPCPNAYATGLYAGFDGTLAGTIFVIYDHD